MARHNDISLYAAIVHMPAFKNNGTKIKAVFPVKVFKGNRNSYDGEIHEKATTPIIATTNPDLINIIKKIKVNDVVLIKGNVITSNSPKPCVCPYCNATNYIEGLLTFINPIAIKIVRSNLTAEEATQELYENKEFSNEACIIGHLCCDPEQISVLRNNTVVQYKIGIPRKFNLKWDPNNEDNKADFPYVKSYGPNAIKDLERLKTGSTVLIDGYLQSRRFDRTIECSGCGESFVFNDGTLEIVPYQTEYLRHLKTDDDDDANFISEVNELQEDK